MMTGSLCQRGYSKSRVASTVSRLQACNSDTRVPKTVRCSTTKLKPGTVTPETMDMREMTYGWNVKMQLKAARAWLRITEISLPYRCRRGDHSKVTGSLKGTFHTSWKIASAFARVACS
jgi:hypothetical protein